jgi:hypothetical protein
MISRNLFSPACAPSVGPFWASETGTQTSDDAPLVPTLQLPDQNDCRVLAAGIVARADVIVTFNMKHFPDDALSAYGCEAQHPDTFLLHQMTLAPSLFMASARRMRARLQNPGYSADECIEGLRRSGLPLLAAELEKSKELI